MTPYTHNHQQSAWSQGTRERVTAPGQAEPAAQVGASVLRQSEQAARAVMHPDHHDPDWRYYFGAIAD